MYRLVFLCLIISCLALTSCSRAFQDVSEAQVSVESPDVNQATTESSILLELKVTSVRDVTRVQSNGIDFSGPSASDTWEAVLPLSMGLNQILIESTVDDGPISIDTVRVFRIGYELHPLGVDEPMRFQSGGHTATVLPDESLHLIGGSLQPGSPGFLDVWRLPSPSSIFIPVNVLSRESRTGHTASLLPDGRILLVGGARSGDIASTSDLVELVEAYNPETQRFEEIAYEGSPIRRMYHSAILREVDGQTVLVLLGGRGDTRYTPSPELGIRQDLRTFLLRNDTLFALSPAVGPFIKPVAGHTQTLLSGNPTSGTDRYLVTGLDFEQDNAGTSFIMDYSSAAGIDLPAAAPMNIPRIRHASVQIAPGIVAHFGGRGFFIDDVYSMGEFYVDAAHRHFLFPEELASSLEPAFGLSASVLPDGRILLIGGFDANGSGLNTVTLMSLSVR